MEGHYANFFKVGYNSLEFILDFGQVYQNSSEELLHTRIITTPAYVRLLLEILEDSVQKYESAFGSIQLRD